MRYLKGRPRRAILRFQFFHMVRSWSSFTHRLVTTRRSPTRETRFILSPEEKDSFLMENGVIQSKLVLFCSFRLARFTGSRTFHLTSSFGLFSMGRKEERKMPKNRCRQRWLAGPVPLRGSRWLVPPA